MYYRNHVNKDICIKHYVPLALIVTLIVALIAALIVTLIVTLTNPLVPVPTEMVEHYRVGGDRGVVGLVSPVVFAQKLACNRSRKVQQV